MTQPEVWFCGPVAYQAAGAATAGWVAAGAATTQQSLVTAASGASGAAGSDQPYFPAGFWQKPKQVAKIICHGVATWPATAQTVIFAFGTSGSAPQSTAATVTATNTFLTSPSYPTQAVAQTNVNWHFDIDLMCKQVGVGTTAVSTAILATGVGGITTAIVNPVGFIPVYGPLPGNVITTFDNSVNQFFWVSVQFSVGTGCAATMTSCYIYGMN